jgi:hypothetical protein
VPNARQPGHNASVAELTHIFDWHADGGGVAFCYRTRLCLGQLAD